MLTAHQRIELRRRAPEHSEIVEADGLVMVKAPGGLTASAIRINGTWAFGPMYSDNHPGAELRQAAAALREVLGC